VIHIYLFPVRDVTCTLPKLIVTKFNGDAVGANLAVIGTSVRWLGRQVQVDVIVALEIVGRALQPGITLFDA
jgi:hypothetical protein